MSSTYKLEPVTEQAASLAADRLGAVLAAHSEWVGPFIVLLDGLNFHKPPSMTSGGSFFELATHRHEATSQVLSALDDAYAEVRDGIDAASVHGEMLERFVWHVLASRFNGRIAACEVHRDGAPISSYRLDAGTRPTSPCVGVEAKTSERALIGTTARRLKHAAKVAWVLGLRSETNDHVAGVFATWVSEDRFREAMFSLVGGEASEAVVVAHEQLSRLPNRLAALQGRLKPAAR